MHHNRVITTCVFLYGVYVSIRYNYTSLLVEQTPAAYPRYIRVVCRACRSHTSGTQIDHHGPVTVVRGLQSWTAAHVSTRNATKVIANIDCR